MSNSKPKTATVIPVSDEDDKNKRNFAVCQTNVFYARSAEEGLALAELIQELSKEIEVVTGCPFDTQVELRERREHTSDTPSTVAANPNRSAN